jgi:NADPH2:quinone reductase
VKAAAYDAPGPPDVLKYVTVADPVPDSDQVLVKVHAIGLQGGDVRARAPSMRFLLLDTSWAIKSLE